MKTMITAGAILAITAPGQAGLLSVNVNPGQAADVSAPLFDASFGVGGSIGIDVELDDDGKLANASLCLVDLIIASGGSYAFGGGGILTLSNIAISLEQKGGQEFFFNETSGVPQPGDYAGFLDTGAIASLEGTFAIDIDGDGNDEISRSFADVDQDDRFFDFEAIITRDGGSNTYAVETFLFLTIDNSFAGQSLPIDVEFIGGGIGFIPAPASGLAIGCAGLLGCRRRR